VLSFKTGHTPHDFGNTDCGLASQAGQSDHRRRRLLRPRRKRRFRCRSRSLAARQLSTLQLDDLLKPLPAECAQQYFTVFNPH